jgi:ATP-dependent Lon protease
MDANGLKKKHVDLTEEAVIAVIRDYTREAGVRNLERELGSVLRHVATQIASNEAEHVKIEPDDLHSILGPVRFESEIALRTAEPGVATGLAWTPVGGDILFIESSAMPGKGGLVLTGQLGDVMKESAQAAITLVKSNLDHLGVAPEYFEKHDVHIHVPAGAIPKDGPSAGVALYTSLVSLVTGRTVGSTLAMTGEISLRGLVLPVGGIKEKILAARHAGIEKVLLPARNRKDFEEIPEDVRADLEFVWMENVNQVLCEALGLEQACREARRDGGSSPERISASAGEG